MLIALAARERCTCPRMKCGAAAFYKGRIVATGYNGAPAGAPHCDQVGCTMTRVRERERCTRAVHAERNALDHNHAVDTLYTTGQPCLNCLDRAIQCGVKRIVWLYPYPDTQRDILLVSIRDDVIVERLSTNFVVRLSDVFFSTHCELEDYKPSC